MNLHVARENYFRFCVLVAFFVLAAAIPAAGSAPVNNPGNPYNSSAAVDGAHVEFSVNTPEPQSGLMLSPTAYFPDNVTPTITDPQLKTEIKNDLQNENVVNESLIRQKMSDSSSAESGRLSLVIVSNATAGDTFSEYFDFSQIPAKNESRPMNIRVVKMSDGIDEIYRESQIYTGDTISMPLEPGKYKVFTQIEGEDTISEYNNKGKGYLVTAGNATVITYFPSTIAWFYIDAPWRVESSSNTIPILIYDTGENWADIADIYVYDHNNGDSFIEYTHWRYPQKIELDQQFFYLFNSDKNAFRKVNGKISIKVKFVFSEWYLPDIWIGPKSVYISPVDLPRFDDWYYGDTHQHTNYSYNVVEIGAPVYATKAANKALGLDWMTVTDHSCDLTGKIWKQQKIDISQNSNKEFRVIQGEEVSAYLPGTTCALFGYCYNHLLVYGADFIPGGEWEDGTGSDYTPIEVINITKTMGGFTFVAHPIDGDPFRAPLSDYTLDFKGLEVWNYASLSVTESRDKGLEEWKKLLLLGRHVFIEGGTDAHGSFDTEAGKVKTVVYIPGYSRTNLPKTNEILASIESGHSIMTDGPLLIFNITNEKGETANIGDEIYGEKFNLNTEWKSTSEFGKVKKILVYFGVVGIGEKEIISSQKIPDNFNGIATEDISDHFQSKNNSYIRMMAVTDQDRKVFTNPIFINLTVQSIVDFYANNTVGTAPLPIQFSDASTGSPTAWNWSFGDGMTFNTTNAASRNVTHVYSGAGTYTVSLKITNTAGTNESTKINYITVDPVLPAYYAVNTSISQGATVFIGEQGLNLAPAQASFAYDAPASIGWWASAAQIGNSTPTATVSLTNASNFHVSYAAFGSSYGNWYALNGTTGAANQSAVFMVVKDPQISIDIWDYTQDAAQGGVSVSGKSVVQGDILGLKVGTNMDTAISQGALRTKTAANETTGWADIKVKTEQGNTYTRMINASNLSNSLLGQNINSPSWFSATNWSTGAITAAGQWVYPIGNYTVTVQSKLNNMYENYQNGGAAYTGKTVSEARTVYITVIVPALVTNFDATPTTGTAPLTVRFTDASTSSPTSWNWSFGDGTNATIQHPVHTYYVAGNHTVTLMTSNAGGVNTTVKDRYIVIYPKGDFNHNWMVDIGDGACVAYMVIGRTPVDPAADFNGTGTVDVGDVAKIAYYLVGKITEL